MTTHAPPHDTHSTRTTARAYLLRTIHRDADRHCAVYELDEAYTADDETASPRVVTGDDRTVDRVYLTQSFEPSDEQWFGPARFRTAVHPCRVQPHPPATTRGLVGEPMTTIRGLGVADQPIDPPTVTVDFSRHLTTSMATDHAEVLAQLGYRLIGADEY